MQDAQVGRSPLWLEAIVIAWLCWLYDIVTNLAPTRRTIALAHAASVLRIERTLSIDPELSLNRWLAGQHALALVLSDYYDNAHFIVTLGLLGLLWWRRPDIYPSLRNALVMANLIGFVVFWLWPMAPPRMLPGNGFVDVVAATHAFGSWHTGSLSADADQYAAMPSLHIAWALWCVIVVWRMTTKRRLRALGLLHIAVTTLVVLSTGNHFVLDVLAGALTALLAFMIVRSIPRLMAHIRPQPVG
jgi:diacylglycerol O-acyltransferase / wax synthase